MPFPVLLRKHVHDSQSLKTLQHRFYGYKISALNIGNKEPVLNAHEILSGAGITNFSLFYRVQRKINHQSRRGRR